MVKNFLKSFKNPVITISAIVLVLALIASCFWVFWDWYNSGDIIYMKKPSTSVVIDNLPIPNPPMDENDDYYYDNDYVIYNPDDNSLDKPSENQENDDKDDSFIYDINDYNTIKAGKEYLKLIVSTHGVDYVNLDGSVVGDYYATKNDLRLNISDEGKGYTFSSGDCLEYDVYCCGKMYNAGIVDLVAEDSDSLTLDTNAVDQNNITAGVRQDSKLNMDMTDYAKNSWYHRKIQIPDSFVGKKLDRWDIVTSNIPKDTNYVILFDNIKLTNGDTVKFTAYSDTNLQKCWRLNSNESIEFSLTPSLFFENEVEPYADAIMISGNTAELLNGQTAKSEVRVSTAGQGKYTLKKGDIIYYKTRALTPLIPGTGAIDIVFTDKSRLTDYSLLDQNGYSIKASNDISSISYGGWLYRKIEIKGNAVGKTIDYWTANVDTTVSNKNFEILYTDIKIVNNNRTEVLAYGGGNMNDITVLSMENMQTEIYKKQVSTNIGSPSEDVLEQKITPTFEFDDLTGEIQITNTISNNAFTINAGDILEYDIKYGYMPEGSGAAIDFVFAEGNYSTLNGCTDQNGISAAAGADIGSYADGWYHRKISLDSISGVSVEKCVIKTLLSDSQSNTVVYIDNVKITNDAKVVQNIYENGRLGITESTQSEIYANTVLVDVKYNPIKTDNNVYNVKSFGAKADGQTDDTKAIQSALFTAQNLGGGVVFLPAGRYAVKSHLIVPSGVALTGEWSNPENGGGKGTILYAYEGRNRADLPSFITVEGTGCINNMSVYYPEQNAKNIVPYPYTIHSLYGLSGNFENITLYNSYYGFKFGINSSENQHAENIYMTALKIGVIADAAKNLKLVNVNINSDIWAKSGLDNAPSGEALIDLKTHLNNNLEAMFLGECQELDMSNITISYAKSGLRFADSRIVSIWKSALNKGSYGNVRNLNIDHAQNGIKCEFLANYITVNGGSINASGGLDPAAAKCESLFTQYLTLEELELESERNCIVVYGNGTVSVRDCNFKKYGDGCYGIYMNNGTYKYQDNNTFADADRAYTLRNSAKREKWQ